MCAEGKQEMTYEKVYILVKEFTSSIHEKLDTVIDNQGKQELQIELIKRDIMGNGSPGIKQLVQANSKKIEYLEKIPVEKAEKNFSKIIAICALLFTAVTLILSITKVI